MTWIEEPPDGEDRAAALARRPQVDARARQLRRRRLLARSVGLLATLGLAIALPLSFLPEGHQAPVRPLGPGPAPSTTSPGPTATVSPDGGTRLLGNLAFLSPTTGYGLFWTGTGPPCDDLVGRTSDGGAHFTPPVLASTSCERQLAFDDHGDGFLYEPGLVESNDGGATWKTIQTAGTVLSVEALGSSIWMVEAVCPPGAATTPTATCPLQLEESDDGGRSWAPSPTQPAAAVAASTAAAAVDSGETALPQTVLVRVSQAAAYVVGSPQIDRTGQPDSFPLWYTADGGASWTQHSAPCGLAAMSSLVSVAPDGTIAALCAAQPQAIFTQPKTFTISHDAGRTWTTFGPCTTSCTSGPPMAGRVHSFDAVSATTDFEIGDSGSLIVTRDGGQIWSTTQISSAPGPDQVTFFDQLHGVVLTTPPPTAGQVGVDQQPTVWHTGDGGETWSAVHPTVGS